ncbi:hypothetical protein AXF42_Ash009885 [Apostasia shenzhenica]|uniref:Protein EXORDIUM-like 2 n=1 Tax=Apostasia shenzhenica TaxID=1088818 RepID=A0A2I0ACC1_9ASPA|nr:hypothetical protein AXF42_Ash009885 [Apostasia shenzhenica]
MASSPLIFKFKPLLFCTISTLLSCAAAFDSPAYPLHSSLILVQQQPLVLRDHNGPLVKGNVTVNLLWYGRFSLSQRSAIASLLSSFSPSSSLHPPPPPTVAKWWATTAAYRGGAAEVTLGWQLLDSSYSLGRSLTPASLYHLARRANRAGAPHQNSVSVVLTADDVTLDGFCMSSCGRHGALQDGGRYFPYIWVGNAASQCPGMCAWPFARPDFGPPEAPLVPPSGDVGVDGMVIILATLMAGTVTNPYGNGYFQGPAVAPLEAASACAGIFGSGSYPGYPGNLLVDPTTNASFNAHGEDERKFLLPAMWDPMTSSCATLV